MHSSRRIEWTPFVIYCGSAKVSRAQISCPSSSAQARKPWSGPGRERRPRSWSTVVIGDTPECAPNGSGLRSWPGPRRRQQADALR